MLAATSGHGRQAGGGIASFLRQPEQCKATRISEPAASIDRGRLD